MKTLSCHVTDVKQRFLTNAIMTDYVNALTDDFIVEMVLDVLINTDSPVDYLDQVVARIVNMYERQVYNARLSCPFVATDVVNAIIISSEIASYTKGVESR